MVRLEGAPAFGLETRNWNANTFYKQFTSGTDRLINQKAYEKFQQILTDTRPVLLGHHVFNAGDVTLAMVERQLHEEAIEEAKVVKRSMNIGKIIGYIPIIGTLSGIARLIGVKMDREPLKAERVKHIIRGSIESLSLGFLLIIPDLIISLRHRRNQNQ
jgi:hypothetical protein